MKPYPTRPTVCEIDLRALKNNYTIIKERAGREAKVLAVVKADAYGHGALKVSRTLENLGVDYLGVAILEEALELRGGGIKSPIVILGGLFEGQEDTVIEHDLTPVIYSLSSAERLNRAATNRGIRCKVHVKIDTGMGRIGVQPEEVDEFFKNLGNMQALEVEGVATHFSSADAPSDDTASSYTRRQIKKFEECLKEIESLGFDIPLRHTANSAALFSFPESRLNLVRPGIMLYGAYPSADSDRVEGLKGVMSLKTKIMDLKEVKKGFRVSYGGSYITPGNAKIAVLPVGYADGYNRKLSNTGEVLVRDNRARVAGKVCMDMTMIDVTDIEGVQIGDEVILFGGNDEGCISAGEVAEKIGTIPYEVFCGISKRVPKVYLED